MTITEQISITLAEEEKENLLKACHTIYNVMSQIDKNLTWYFKLGKGSYYESPYYERSELYETACLLQYLGNCDVVTFGAEDEK